MIAFTADNHIGVTTQWSIKSRGEDFMASFGDMVDSLHAVKEGGALIIGGDLFDMVYPPSFAVEFVQSEIRRLSRGGKYHVFGIDGNHDISGGRWLRVCGITPLTEEPVEVCDGVTACGLGYQRHADLVESLNSMAGRDVKCDILVLHIALGELNRMGSASDVSAAEIMPSIKEMGVKLVLMGHIHMSQDVEIDGIRFVYSGSTEMCSMNEQKDKSFVTVDPKTFAIGRTPIKTRKIEPVVIGSEEEFAKFESSARKNSKTLYSMFVSSDIKDGVTRLRALAASKNLLMRVQTVHQVEVAEDDTDRIDRTAGVIGLEQALELSFKPDSVEAELIRAILRAPEALKVTVGKFMDGEEAPHA
jgi:DNA repair exonuclease SbcCD nuclease subunit